MEFGVIASAIGVIGVAAQTIEVITKVRSLVQEAKDAPSNIQNIAAELDILARTLSGIEMQVRQTNQPAFSDPSPALLYCQQGIEQIAVSVTQLQSDIARRKKRGLLRALWKKDELATHLARIERAKNSLMLAHSLYSSGLMLNKMDILSIAVAQSAQMLDVNNAAIASVLASRRPTPSQYNLAKLQTSPQTPDTSLLAGESHFNKDGQAFSSRKRASQPLNAMQTYMLRFHVSVWIWSRSWEVIVKQAVAGWDIRIRTCRVLPRDSEFFRACGRGDLSLVQNMFSSGKASPFDRDMDGLTGVHYFARGTLSPQAQLIMPAYEWLGFYKFLIESGSEITADHHENWGRLAPRIFGRRPSSMIADSDPHEILRISFARKDFDLDIQTIYQLLCFTTRPTAMLLHAVAWPPWQEISISERIRSISFGRDFHPSSHYILGMESVDEIWSSADPGALRIIIHRSYRLYAKEWAEGADLTVWRRCYGKALQRGALLPVYFLSTFLQAHFLEVGRAIPHESASKALQQAIEAFALELQELTPDLEACAHTHRSNWLSDDGRELELLQQDNTTYIGHIDGLCHGSRPEDWRIWVSSPMDAYAEDFWNLCDPVPQFFDSSTKVLDPVITIPGGWPNE